MKYIPNINVDMIYIGPKDVYQAPMTTSQEYGWHDGSEKESWMQNKRHVHVNSEMTKYVRVT